MPLPPENKLPWWKRWRIVLVVGAPLLLLIVAYAILWERYYRHDPIISRDYAAELNAPILKVPPEQRAWTHYRKALLLLEPLPAAPPGVTTWPEVRPNHKGWSAMVRYLRTNRAALETIRRAARMRPLGVLFGDFPNPEDLAWMRKHCPDEVPRESVSTDVPTGPVACDVRLQSTISLPIRFLRISYLLRADALRAANDGDAEGVVENLVALLDIAEQTAEIPMLVDQLIARTLAEIGLECANDLLANQPDVFSSAALARLAKYLDVQAGLGPVRTHCGGERAYFADVVQHCFTDDGQGNGVLRLEIAFGMLSAMHGGGASLSEPLLWNRLGFPLLSPFVADRKATLAKHEEICTRIEAQMQLPLWQRDRGVIESIEEEVSVSPPRFVFLKALVSAFDVYMLSDERSTQQRDATRVAVALARFQLANGRWPKSLNELVPKFLPSVPPDRFDGKPLRYRLRDGQPVVYSIGTNLRDDGGVAAEKADDAAQWPPDPSVAGDWILFPLQVEPPTERLHPIKRRWSASKMYRARSVPIRNRNSTQ